MPICRERFDGSNTAAALPSCDCAADQRPRLEPALDRRAIAFINGSACAGSLSNTPCEFLRSPNKIRGQRNARMRFRVHGFDLIHGIGDDGGDRRFVVGEAIDERRVGAVLEQAAHEIGKQILVRADRRIDAALHAELIRADRLVVELLAHAVQALEFVVVALARHRLDRGQRVRVVRREHRKERRRDRRATRARRRDTTHRSTPCA